MFNGHLYTEDAEDPLGTQSMKMEAKEEEQPNIQNQSKVKEEETRQMSKGNDGDICFSKMHFPFLFCPGQSLIVGATHPGFVQFSGSQVANYMNSAIDTPRTVLC